MFCSCTKSSDFRNCGLTDADWDDVKACLVVAGDEMDFPITTL